MTSHKSQKMHHNPGHKANPHSKAVKLHEAFGDVNGTVNADGTVNWDAMDAVYDQLKADEKAGLLKIKSLDYSDDSGVRHFGADYVAV